MSIARIYRSMRVRQDLTLNLKSMAVYCAFFVAYAMAFTVWVEFCVREATQARVLTEEMIDEGVVIHMNELMKHRSIAAMI